VEERNQIYVGGQFVNSDAKGRIDVISPNTEEVIGRVPDATPKDVDRAVAAAREAFDKGPFPRWSAEERSAAVTRLSEALKKRGQDIAKTIASENGCPISMSFGTQVFASTMVLDIFAEIGKTFPFEEKRKGAMGQTVYVRRAPVGVVAAVVPWNVPLYVIAMKLGPALASGCTVIVKAAPETALDPYALMEAAQDAGLPPGVLNILSAGRETSEYLVKHPGIDKVSFTGSTATGQRIGEICGSQIKRCTLELGGKSAGIVLEDVNVAAAVPQMLGAGLLNNGQACAAQTRFLVARKRYKEVVDAMAAGMAAMKVGDSLDPTTQIGPVVAKRQRDKILGYLEAGKKAGAKVATGGGKPKGRDKGWFIEPTLFYDANNQMTIAREEIFGPVLTVIPFDSEEQAIAIANDSDFGLGGGVWCGDNEHGVQVARQIRTGVVAVNSAMLLDFRSPFGGFKKSGIGRECGPEGFGPYTEYQTIVLPMGS
jgi:betaine-aldehyde dehydrogenase